MTVFGVYGQTSQTTVVRVNAQAPTFLYGGQASSVAGDIHRQNGDFFPWRGSGQLTWEILVDQPGEYEVNLCHAAQPDAIGQQLQISSGQGQLSYTLAMTQGVFGKKTYALTPIPFTKGSLHLAAGTNTISLSITDAPAGKTVLDFRSLELIPVAAKAAIEADRQEAQRARASTEWMAKAGYGLMFHWTSQSVGKDGTHKPYAQAVDDFDVNHWAETVEETGAGYVILTIGHAESVTVRGRSKLGKNTTPARQLKRDLIAEMADALNAKGIKLICYLNVGQSRRISKSQRRGIHPDA